MTSNVEHQKHTKLVKPAIGNFGRNELALLGTPCGRIKKLAWELIAHLKEVAFVDADHKAAELESEPALHHGASLAFTDKINFRRFDYVEDANPYQIKKFFNEANAVIVNGNHFKAAHQIVLIDPKKPLDRKLDRITAPILVVLTPEATEIPDYLRPQLQNIPVLKWEDIPAIVQFVRQWVDAREPMLRGLVLAGGQSQRMAQDKGALEYHGHSQRQHLYEQLNSLGIASWISCRAEQEPELETELPKIVDSFQGLGPMGALLSAFRWDPNAAWLAVACDLPFLQEETLRYLVSHRDASKVATAFRSPFDEFPEPLITIWEPKSYAVLLQFLSQGYSCPRKALINSNVTLLDAPNAKDLSNINHPHELEEAMRELRT